jgi:hypothetical protein
VIEGKVAAILNARELAINKGSKDGVKEGMKFAVLDTTGSEIKDPDTNTVIGSVLRTKIKVRIVQVQAALSVGRTYEKTPGRGGLFGSPTIADMLQYEVPRPRTLATEEALFPPLTESESYIKRGDPVRQISDDE